MKDLHELTDLQLAILHEVWKRGEATVTDVWESLLDETGLAKKTIGTMMARLEKQQFLTHAAAGREFVYQATVSRKEVGSAKLRNVLDRIFGGNVTALVSHALETEEVRPGDLEKVRKLISEWEIQEKKGPAK
jgi:BlaI family transcriptional regulator, penicillinase repressor